VLTQLHPLPLSSLISCVGLLYFLLRRRRRCHRRCRRRRHVIPPSASPPLAITTNFFRLIVVLYLSLASAGGDGSVGAHLLPRWRRWQRCCRRCVPPYSSPEAPITACHRRHRHFLTLSRCAAPFFDMLGNCVYSVETILNSK